MVVTPPASGWPVIRPVPVPAPVSDVAADEAIPLEGVAQVTPHRPESAPNIPASRQELPLKEPGLRGTPRGESVRTEADESVPSSTATAISAGSGEPMKRLEGLAGGPESREARNLPKESTEVPRAAGLADRVTVTVADENGRPTRIRVAVVGEQVRATIVPPDGESARQLERRMDDLTAALVRRGFAEPRVTIQAAAEAGPVWAGAANTVRTEEVPRGTEQPAGDQRQGSGRREQERQGDGQHRHPQGRPRQRDPDDRGR